MAIYAQDKLFNLETKSTLYQMKVDQFGMLWHLWYGPKTNEDMSYLYDYPNVGVSGVPYEARALRTHSPGSFPQEYSTFGVADFRIPAISVTHSDGTNALDLRFESYEIVSGKYSLPGLPAVYANEDEAQTIHVTLRDTASKIGIILTYAVLPEHDIITRSVTVKNDGESAVMLNRVHSLCLDIPYGDYEWIHFQGRHVAERHPERCELFHGIQEVGSVRGTSSHQQSPSVILCEKDCTETSGFCIGATMVYSGGCQIQVEKDQLDQTRLVMGIHPETFSWKLDAGEAFYAPEVILSCSSEGFGALSRRFHGVIRNHVCRGKYQLTNRPLLINNWEATYFDFDEEKIYNIAKKASELGVEMLVLDDGWFGERNNDDTSLGDWFVDKNKLPNGLGRLVERVNELGMKFGLWFEPEMISEISKLYQEHPDWAIKIPGRKPVISRDQLVLDMSRADVREYLYQVISDILKSANIEYVKWDMNRSICDWYSAELPADRQGELPHRYVLGLYELLERLTTDFPHVLFEGCCGGGGRFDAGMMYYHPQIWCSDDTDAHERTKIQYGTSFFYPISTVGSHVSAVPNHQTGRVTSIDTRGVVAMAGSFGYELDLNQITDEEKAKVAEQVVRFKKYNTLIHNGDYYRLSNPMKENMAAWSFVSKDKSEVLVQGVIFRARPNALRSTVKLSGLEADARYRLILPEQEAEAVYMGEALMQGGILLPRAWGDDISFEFYYQKI